MNLIIRADATPAIGIGHVMRCIALAQYWDAPVHFISHCEATSVLELIRSYGFKSHGVADSQAGWDVVSELANQGAEQAIVFDGYGFTATDYHRASSFGLTVVAVDDNAHLPEYPIDVLVNQNPHATSLRYLTRPGTRRLLGSDYALVRKEFTTNAIPRVDVHKTATLLVTLGGSDVANLTPMIIRAVRQVGGMNVVVVAGPANQRGARLREMIEGDLAIRLESSVLDMSSLMREADIVITAAGSTCWECCCLGVPMLTMVAAENQRSIGEALAAAGASVNLGWHEQVTADLVASKLTDLINDADTRRRMAANGKKIVDGKGASRVAETIVYVVRHRGPEGTRRFPEDAPARLRPVEATDIDTVFLWRNSDEIRRYMFNNSRIEWPDHCKWFEKTCQSERKMFFIFEWEGSPFGAVYFSESRENPADLIWGFYVAPEHENAGYGGVMGFMGLSLAFDEFGASCVTGEVLELNVKSIQFHRKLGFVEVGTRSCLVNGTLENVRVLCLRAEAWYTGRYNARAAVVRGRPQFAWLT